jgi:hypothetical protein
LKQSRHNNNNNNKWNAKTYHNISTIQEKWGKEVIEIKKWKGNEIVMDAGCGTGRITKILAQKVRKGGLVNNPTAANSISRLLDLPEKQYGHSQWIGKVIMHVDLNSFFPSCEELRDPTLIGKPHAVLMTTDETKDKITRGAVASCSYEARKDGVRSAMSLFAYYQQVSDKVMRLLEEYADVRAD